MVYKISYITCLIIIYGLPGGASGKQPGCQFRRQETRVPYLDGEDPLEKGRATHSSILAWRLPRTVEPGGLR